MDLKYRIIPHIYRASSGIITIPDPIHFGSLDVIDGSHFSFAVPRSGSLNFWLPGYSPGTPNGFSSYDEDLAHLVEDTSPAGSPGGAGMKPDGSKAYIGYQGAVSDTNFYTQYDFTALTNETFVAYDSGGAAYPNPKASNHIDSSGNYIYVLEYFNTTNVSDYIHRYDMSNAFQNFYQIPPAANSGEDVVAMSVNQHDEIYIAFVDPTSLTNNFYSIKKLDGATGTELDEWGMDGAGDSTEVRVRAIDSWDDYIFAIVDESAVVEDWKDANGGAAYTGDKAIGLKVFDRSGNIVTERMENISVIADVDNPDTDFAYTCSQCFDLAYYPPTKTLYMLCPGHTDRASGNGSPIFEVDLSDLP